MAKFGGTFEFQGFMAMVGGSPLYFGNERLRADIAHSGLAY